MIGDSFLRSISLPFRRIKLFAPFFYVYLLKYVVWVPILFYSVQWPLKLITGPIILRFWGPAALHYPQHIFWMYEILKRSSWFFDVLLGTAASFFLILLLWRALRNRGVVFNFWLFFLYILISIGLFFLGQKGFPVVFIKLLSLLKISLSPKIASLVVLSSVILFNSFLQSLFIFPLIAMIVEARLSGFLEGIKVLRRYLLPTVALFLTAFSLFIPFIFIEPVFLRSGIVINLPETIFIFPLVADMVSIFINTLVFSVLVGWYNDAKVHGVV